MATRTPPPADKTTDNQPPPAVYTIAEILPRTPDLARQLLQHQARRSRAARDGDRRAPINLGRGGGRVARQDDKHAHSEPGAAARCFAGVTPVRRNRCLDAVVAELRAAGIAFTTTNGGKHIKVRWSAGGEARTTVVSVSPSDWRAPRAARAFVRRQIRELGVAVVA